MNAPVLMHNSKNKICKSNIGAETVCYLHICYIKIHYRSSVMRFDMDIHTCIKLLDASIVIMDIVG
jgi:hypothetical protein